MRTLLAVMVRVLVGVLRVLRLQEHRLHSSRIRMRRHATMCSPVVALACCMQTHASRADNDKALCAIAMHSRKGPCICKPAPVSPTK